MNRTTRAGVYWALTTALISGVSIYLNKFASRAVADVLLFTTLKNSMVGLALIVFLATRIDRAHAIRLNRKQGLGLVVLALIGGSVPFLLFFQGLSQISAPSAALIHKSLFLWVALLAVPMLGERPSGWVMIGLGLLGAGQLISGWPGAWGWGAGESLILLATLLWAGETILVKRLLPNLPSTYAAAARMAGGAIVMWLYLLATGQAASVPSLALEQWGWVAVTSILLLGYVTTWYAALKRAPATIVTSVLTAGAVVTAALNVIEGNPLIAAQWIGMLIMLAGVAWMMRALHIQRRQDAGLSA